MAAILSRPQCVNSLWPELKATAEEILKMFILDMSWIVTELRLQPTGSYFTEDVIIFFVRKFINLFWYKYHWNFILRVQLTSCHHCFKWWLGTKQAPSHYLSPGWPSSMIQICITSWGLKWVNTLRLRQNGHHFPDDIFKCIFLNENVWISIKISLKCVSTSPINNIPVLVQIMAWCCPGDKPLSETKRVSLLMHICITLPQKLCGHGRYLDTL